VQEGLAGVLRTERWDEGEGERTERVYKSLYEPSIHFKSKQVETTYFTR
jgi:hypothetical protein